MAPLGLIIEKVSGSRFEEFLAHKIFNPLGMKNTRVNSLTDLIANRASGYHWRQDLLQNAGYVSPSQKWAAGAVVSTANDLGLWSAALDANALIRPETLRLMETLVRLLTGESAKYGFVIELDVDYGHQVSGHQGGGPAFNATPLPFPDDKLSVAVICNLTQGPSKRIAYHIAALFLPTISD
jgi:CubicO group peptidase (beta-lactamase class C family)